MTPEDSFLRSIAENPNDPSIILIFADWLEDQGDPRALFLRQQVRIEESFDILRPLSKDDHAESLLVTDRGTGRLSTLVRSPHRPGWWSFSAIWKEAGIAARCSHACLLPLETLGFSQGYCFYSVPYIEGRSLHEILPWAEITDPRSQFPLDHRALLLLKIAEAIQHAHSLGILHLHLNPNAILLEPDLERVFVTNWKFSKTLDCRNEDYLDSFPPVFGNPRWLAPEHFSQQDHNLSVTVDVYGLGMILYVMLTGHSPHEGSNILDLMVSITSENPTRPAEINPQVSPELEAICMKCLQRDPALRYPSVQSLIEDLHRYLAGEWEWPDEPSPIKKILLWCRNLLPGSR